MKRMIIDYDFMVKHGCFNACVKAYCEAKFSHEWKRTNTDKIALAINSDKRRIQKALNIMIEEGTLERKLETMRANGHGTALGTASYYRLIRRDNE